MNEFKPGDVVVHPEYGRGIMQDSIVGWGARGGFSMLRGVAADLRRLVVIDPEDREQVERLRDLMDEAWVDQGNGQVEARTRGARGNALQAALCEFADPKPPKPEEPTGLGAVVEDARGERWVWNAAGAGGNHWLRVGPPTVWAAWTSIDAVRVLSEGVQP